MVKIKQSKTYGKRVKVRGSGMSDDIALDAKGYWKAMIRLTLVLLIIWFLASFGAGILFRETLDNFSIGGAPLGFWFAQNGSIYVFLVLIIIYCRKMTQYEKKFGVKG
jgi:putative solute:sodium symporter small subunit